MRISSEEYEGLKQRVYDIIENECWVPNSPAGSVLEGVGDATDVIMKNVIDQLVKIKEITW